MLTRLLEQSGILTINRLVIMLTRLLEQSGRLTINRLVNMLTRLLEQSGRLIVLDQKLYFFSASLFFKIIIKRKDNNMFG